LLINADHASNRILLEVLARSGIRGLVAEDLRSGLEFLDRHAFQLVVVDLVFLANNPYGSDYWIDQHAIRQIRTNQPELPMIMLLDASEVMDIPSVPDNRHLPCIHLVSSIVQDAIGIGIDAVLCRPFTYEQAKAMIGRFLPAKKIQYLAYKEDMDGTGCQIVGKSQALQQAVAMAKRLASTSAPVLICGESGTGKELFAQLIHDCSKRSAGPYVKVNCAALNDTLLDSELFGHERGAFTGAVGLHKGRFERANAGTILLDEITETPLRFQAKLLRVLEQQELERVGGREPIKVDVRVISTTNTDIAGLVRAGRFRQDLYYRLCATRLVIPPLRERLEDLEDLVWHFVNIYARECGRAITSVDPGMLEIFRRYHWPGNIRQLRNVVRTCLTLGSGPVLKLSEMSWLMDASPIGLQPLAMEMHGGLPSPDVTVEGPYRLGGIPLERLERMAIMETLAQTAGNRKKAADLLGISDRTLREKLRRYKAESMLHVGSDVG
jgi:DNA-binding NtrC family response regulator